MGMFPYYFMLILILICAYQYEVAISEKMKRNLLILSLVPVFCLLAFKSEKVGVDTENYIRMYNTAGELLSIDNESRIEIGYQYMSIWLNKLFDSNQALFICSSFIISFSLYVFLKKSSSNPVLALFFFITLGFFQFALTGIRQGIAIAITLFAIPYIQQKKLIKFLIVIVLASIFHKSALFSLPLYWIMNLKVTTRNMIVMLASMIVAYFMAEPFLLTAADILGYDYGVEATGNGFEFMIFVLIITLICYSKREELKALRNTNVFLINANYVSLLMWVLRLLSRTAERVSLFYMPYTYVSLEEYLVSRPKSVRKYYMIISVLIAFYLFYHRMSPSDYLNNYTFFWQ